MKASKRAGRFRRSGENLYRYSSNGVYYAVYRSHGKLIWKSLQTSDHELAKRKLANELDDHGRVDHTTSKTTLEELLVLYEEQLPQFDKGTRANKESILKKFRSTWHKSITIPVRAITSAHLQAWLHSEDVQRNWKLKSSPRRPPRQISKWTYNQYARFLRQVFAIAVGSNILPGSPAAALKDATPEKPIRLTPSWDQFQAIVKDIRTQKFNSSAEESADLVEFMGLAGVGTAESASLLGEHIDFEKGRVNLYRKKTDSGYSIPIFPQLKPLLEKFRDKGAVQNGRPVFTIADPKKALDGACKRLKFPHFSSRALRRCFITRAIELGVDFKTISGWQGHQDGGVLIAKAYSHLRNEHSDNMAKKLV